MPNYQERTPRHGSPKRIRQITGQPPENDFRVGEVRGAPFITLVLSDVMESERLLAAGPDIDFVDSGPKANITFTLTNTGIAAATYGAALKIPIIQFDVKGRAIGASETNLGTAALLDADNDATLAANSSARVPTQAAVKAFVSQAVAGLLEYKGDLNCSANPNYPAAEKGDSYVVTVAGRIGGASGKLVDVGDFIIARADNAGGTEAAVGTSWFVLEHNLAGALLAANNLADVANPVTARANIGAGTVTSVDASGGTTGLTFSGGPITGAGTLTLGGTVGVANGGTGTATAFTAGSIVYAGASGVYSQDNSNFFWDATNKRLGIGTASPSERAHVKGAGKQHVFIENSDSSSESGVHLKSSSGGSTFYEWFIVQNNTTGALNFTNFYNTGGSTLGGLRFSISKEGLLNFSGGSLGRGAPVTKTADFTVGEGENWLINNKSGSTCTVTLPSAATFSGREIMIKTIQAQTVVSASANVVPLAGGAAATAILAATAGKWAKLVSDGTNWIIMQAA